MRKYFTRSAKICHYMSISGAICQDLVRSDKLCKDVTSAKIRHALTSAEIWRDLIVFCKIWQDSDRFNEWQDLVIFDLIWRCAARFGEIWRTQFDKLWQERPDLARLDTISQQLG